MEKKVPVGKIDFLDTNGEVGETCYHTERRQIMDDKEIVGLYWEHSEDAIAQTEKKYGRYCHYTMLQS